MRNIAIILAAGNSVRCGFDKLFTNKFGEPVIFQTCRTFQQCDKIDEILVIISTKKIVDSETNLGRHSFEENAILLQKQFPKISKILPGGTQRFFSLKNAIEYIKKKVNCRIIVHNGANPNLTNSDLKAGIALAEKQKNIIFGFFAKDSIKQVHKGKVVKILNRDEIFQTQTPQISDLKTFIKAFEAFDRKDKNIPRDEAELLKTIDEKIFVYECYPNNQKVTFPQDFSSFKEDSNRSFRIGVGEDSHRFAVKYDSHKPVILGGITFPQQISFHANSDGDVILHALCNAILSAVGEKTLDTFAANMCQKGITNSQKYIEKALETAQKKFSNFEIQNVICSLECKTPHLSPMHENIVNHCAKILSISKDKIGLTYTSGEGLSDAGKGLGIQCLVEILITI
ncbi:2-C-methyl-D-erythritol 2,4-cyclodiphosphate synthase [Candidatus Gracilibacteria bacterium]|nr:2-C-methyl-D-erythritol 2,4-cyclodiphosphate synthase [Candidatus Gracilibacteria bacterium]